MSLRGPEVTEWEDKLKEVFDLIDVRLEEKYGGRYPLHPNRAPLGATSDPESDGLFNVGAAFSAGFGSELGPGYIVEVRMSTLAHVPDDVRRQIEEDVVRMLVRELPHAFPRRRLKVSKDGSVYKIHGDLKLTRSKR
jgi:hypothetical protein